MNRFAVASKGLLSIASKRTFTALPRIVKPQLPAAVLTTQRFSSTLAKALKESVELEKENVEINQDFLDAKKLIEKSFTINDVEGTSIVTLTRKVGNETITVTYDCMDIATSQEFQDEEYSEESVQSQPTLLFKVNITKEGEAGSLYFEGVASQETFDIEKVVPLANGKTDDFENVYTGPAFHELESELSEKFLDYLYAKKVDQDLAFFIMSHAVEKEQKEFVNWLDNIQKFVAK